MGLLTLVVLFFLMIRGTTFEEGEVTLQWDANRELNVVGYQIHYGTSPGQYQESIDVGKVTKYTVTGLRSGTYYFSVKAYNSSSQESEFSQEISHEIAVPSSSCRSGGRD